MPAQPEVSGVVASIVARLPTVVGSVTLVAGAGLAIAPQRLTGLLGLDGQDVAMRAIGLSDLVLVPGLLRGRPRWPWMIGRAALNLGVIAYLHAVAPHSSSAGVVKGAKGLFAVLTVVDGATGLALRRVERHTS